MVSTWNPFVRPAVAVVQVARACSVGRPPARDSSASSTAAICSGLSPEASTDPCGNSHSRAPTG